MTEQLRDMVRLEGRDDECWRNSPWLLESHSRVVARPDFDSLDTSTSCGCGYQTFWEVRDNRLYLKRISGPRYELLGEEPLLADWYSGTASIGYGYDWNAIPMFQSLLYLDIERGVVVRMYEEICPGATAGYSAGWHPNVRQVFGPENRKELDLVIELAGLFDSLGYRGRAISMYRRALDASEKGYGTEHEQSIDLAGKLANILGMDGQQDRVEELCLRFPAIRDRSPHPMVNAKAQPRAGEANDDERQLRLVSIYIERNDLKGVAGVLRQIQAKRESI